MLAPMSPCDAFARGASPAHRGGCGALDEPPGFRADLRSRVLLARGLSGDEPVRGPRANGSRERRLDAVGTRRVLRADSASSWPSVRAYSFGTSHSANPTSPSEPPLSTPRSDHDVVAGAAEGEWADAVNDVNSAGARSLSRSGAVPSTASHATRSRTVRDLRASARARRARVPSRSTPSGQCALRDPPRTSWARSRPATRRLRPPLRR